MSERMVLYLGENLDWVELHGMPRLLDEGRFTFRGASPSRTRFRRDEPQDVLVWSERENRRFVYVAVLIGAYIARSDEKVLRWHDYKRLDRPVRICEGDEPNVFYDREKGFCNDFAYISVDDFNGAMKESRRKPPARRRR